MINKNYQISELRISRASRSLIIDAWISVPTRRSSTNNDYFVTTCATGDFRAFEGNKKEFTNFKPTLSLPFALLQFWISVRRYVRDLQKVNGEFDLETSDFTKGILRFY